MEKKKIFFITHHYSHGGSIRILTWLANYLDSTKKYDVFFCSLSNETEQFYPLNVGVTKIDGTFKRTSNFFVRNTIDEIRERQFLDNIFNQIRPNIVVNFGDHSFYSIVSLKKKWNFKLLISQRVDPTLSYKLSDKIRLRKFRKADKLVVQTKAVYDFFTKIPCEKKVVIFNPIKIAETKWNCENCDDYIINVARIDLRQKRQDLLIQAFSIIHKNHPNLKLFLFGEDPNNELPILLEEVKKYQLQDCVYYKGMVTNVDEFMQKAKCLVLTSDYEGIPNVVLEAMNVGTPVVCTDCKPDGGKLLIKHLENGYLAKLGNVDDIAAGIELVLKDNTYCNKFSKNAKLFINRFSEENIGKIWVSMIDEL